MNFYISENLAVAVTHGYRFSGGTNHRRSARYMGFKPRYNFLKTYSVKSQRKKKATASDN